MLSLLVFPLTQALLLGLLALLCMRWRRLSRVLLVLSLGWLYACSTALVADWLFASLEEAYPPRAMSVLPTADAIVLLGGSIRGDTHLGSLPDLNDQADRLAHAAVHYKAGKAPVILLTGGAAPGNRPESEQMAQYMELMGVPPGALLQERQSRDTQQNALYSAVLLRAREARTILLVTSAFHMRRAVPLFEREGLQVIPAPTDFRRKVVQHDVPRWLPSVQALERSTYAIREYAGYLYYQYRNWL